MPAIIQVMGVSLCALSLCVPFPLCRLCLCVRGEKERERERERERQSKNENVKGRNVKASTHLYGPYGVFSFAMAIFPLRPSLYIYKLSLCPSPSLCPSLPLSPFSSFYNLPSSSFFETIVNRIVRHDLTPPLRSFPIFSLVRHLGFVTSTSASPLMPPHLNRIFPSVMVIVCGGISNHFLMPTTTAAFPSALPQLFFVLLACLFCCFDVAHLEFHGQGHFGNARAVGNGGAFPDTAFFVVAPAAGLLLLLF